MKLSHEELKNLRDKTFRRESGIFLVEGEKFCRDLNRQGVEIVYTLTSDRGLIDFPNIVYLTSKEIKILSTTKTNQDTLCVCKIKDFAYPAEGNSLILDTLQDPGNVGTLIRSAVAFGYRDIYLIDCAFPYSEKVIRSSAGTILQARIHITTYAELIERQHEVAPNFIVAVMSGEPIAKIRLPKGNFAVIIGNEGQGVSSKLMPLAKIRLAIPMSSQVESLNAGVAGSIIMQRLSEV